MSTAIVWFRQDLRLTDNPALFHALDHCDRVIPLYIHTPEESGRWRAGAASRWWLHHSLKALHHSLQEHDFSLVIRHGPSLETLQQLIKESGATHIYWNRLYEPAHIARDTQIKQRLRHAGITVESFNASLWFEPWQGGKDDGTPYRVFTPYWKSCLRQGLPHPAVPVADFGLTQCPSLKSLTLNDLRLLPDISWDKGFYEGWEPGEAGAQKRLDEFIDHAMLDYKDARDLPDHGGTSRLSPHLHFGEIGPRQIAARIEQHLAYQRNAGLVGAAESYLRELGWREFAYHLLYHFPHTTEQPLDPRFSGFRWAENATPMLDAWQKGQTGIPIVDAGMRELWRTGWMHNRVRMIAASLLSKNMLIPWQEGSRWFWDTLVDADLASNTLGWQWVAGCGADAAPYFRIFNPVLQGEKFDPQGGYVRRWVPELAGLPDKYIHQPWQAPDKLLQACGLKLGREYPLPIVDLKQSREEALARYRMTK